MTGKNKYRGRKTRCFFPRHTFDSAYSRTAIFQGYADAFSALQDEETTPREFRAFMRDVSDQMDEEMDNIFHQIMIGELSEEPREVG